MRLPLCALVVTLALLLVSVACGDGAAPAPAAEPASTGTPPPAPQSPTAAPTHTPLPAQGSPAATEAPATPEAAAPFELSTSAFEDGGVIPDVYTCQGDNVSPALQWSGVPDGAKALALVIDDPDANGFVHWVIHNIPPESAGLPRGIPPDAILTDGSFQGPNNFAARAGGAFPGGSTINGIGYDGPCPPAQHTYVFTLYALDGGLGLAEDASAREVKNATEGHTLATATLRGIFPG